MKSPVERLRTREEGFSLIEVLVASAITVVIMAAVYALLYKGQDSFRREPEISDLNQSARVGLDMISRDLLHAGYRVPPPSAVLWTDGTGINPDELTIVYAVEEFPMMKPYCPGGGGGCGTLMQSATAWIDYPGDPDSVDPLMDPTTVYEDGMVLMALETSDCNNDNEIGISPFELTGDPLIAGGKLKFGHNPGSGSGDINVPGGFNESVIPDCAVFGYFHVIQYRINPPPPTENPMLERRDLSAGEPWTPVSRNIENLQVQYAVGVSQNFVDVPAQPLFDDPTTWITRVRVTVAGRTESTDLQGASQGVFAAEDSHLRKTFSTVVSLRNQVYSAAEESNYANYN